MAKRAAKPFDDVELYELLLAAYPEKFENREENDDLWEEVMDFAHEISTDGPDALCEVLGRVIMLTVPIVSPLTKTLRHAFGRVEIEDGQAQLIAAVSRNAN